MTLWMVRAGRHGEGESYVLANSVVGIGWADLGDISRLSSMDALRRALQVSNPDAKPSTLTNWAAQLLAFTQRIKIGDLVALPLKNSPAVAFGRVTGDYMHVPDAPEPVRHQRSVTWIREDVPRTAIDQDLLYSLGAFLTVCQIKRNNAEQRITALLGGQPPPGPRSDDSEPALHDESDQADLLDLAQISRDQIAKRIEERFRGHDLARLVGELLSAEGYITAVSPAGPDGGVDILAGQGEMGFDGASLAVQVKSGGTVVDAPTLRELQGVMANFGATRGLLVSWGGFNKGARAEARRLFFQIRLWDSEALIEKVAELYDRLPAQTQADLPLRQLWTLVPDEES